MGYHHSSSGGRSSSHREKRDGHEREYRCCRGIESSTARICWTGCRSASQAKCNMGSTSARCQQCCCNACECTALWAILLLYILISFSWLVDLILTIILWCQGCRDKETDQCGSACHARPCCESRHVKDGKAEADDRWEPCTCLCDSDEEARRIKPAGHTTDEPAMQPAPEHEQMELASIVVVPATEDQGEQLSVANQSEAPQLPAPIEIAR